MPHKGMWNPNAFRNLRLTSSFGTLEIMQQIGELFLLRININLVGSVLDSPVGYLVTRH